MPLVAQARFGLASQGVAQQSGRARPPARPCELVIGASKFAHGAWIVAVGALLVLLFLRISQPLCRSWPVTAPGRDRAAGWHAPHPRRTHRQGGASRRHQALNYACSIADEVTAVFVEAGAGHSRKSCTASAGGRPVSTPVINLVTVPSPYRSLTAPSSRHWTAGRRARRRLAGQRPSSRVRPRPLVAISAAQSDRVAIEAGSALPPPDGQNRAVIDVRFYLDR